MLRYLSTWRQGLLQTLHVSLMVEQLTMLSKSKANIYFDIYAEFYVSNLQICEFNNECSDNSLVQNTKSGVD